MNDFSTPGTINIYGVVASPTNYIVPGKMPMSSMCPTLVLDGDDRVRLLTGASGGPFITTHTALVGSHEFFVALYFVSTKQIATCSITEHSHYFHLMNK